MIQPASTDEQPVQTPAPSAEARTAPAQELTQQHELGIPRLARFGRGAPIINSVLFSLYHFWTPWQFFSRILVVLPWSYLAWRKHNLYAGLAVHCLLNLLGTLLTFAAIFR